MSGLCPCGVAMKDHEAIQLGGPKEFWIHFSPPGNPGKVCHVVDGRDARLTVGTPMRLGDLKP